MLKPTNITDLDWKLLQDKYDNLDSVLEKLNNNYPVQYLIGDVDFYGFKILVDERVLIPRFETEGLVEKTIELINKYNIEDVLEVGTGSGCISIALKKLTDVTITAIDISTDSLDLASTNAINNNASIEFMNSDIFKYKPDKKYDLLISNPPYINKELVIDPKCKYEPERAIYADNKGLIFYEYMIKNYNVFMKDKFIMAFEIGEEQGKYLVDYAKKYINFANIFVEKDLSGRDRYLFIINE